MVKRRRGIVLFWRRAKGFSLSELKKVGLNIDKALKLGIPVDPRRKTNHEDNVEKLREFLKAL
ncbi:MAG: ribosomal protein L13e [Thermoproteota archaeon]